MSITETPSITPGSPAPEFSLPATSGEVVSLAAHRGQRNVLLAFFPKAFTSVCTSEMCAFSDDFDLFAAKNVEVLPVSVDTVDELSRFREAHGLRVHLLSDVGGAVARQYGALWKDGTVANRAYFLIDQEGIVRWAHVEEHPGLKRENAEIFEQISSVIS